MKIQTNGNDFSQEIEIISLVGFELTSVGEPRADQKTGTLKLGPSGRPTYSVRGLSAVADGRVVDSLYLAVEEPAAVPRMTPVVLTGKVLVTPFVSNGNLALSVVAEGMKAAPLGGSPGPTAEAGKPAGEARTGLPTPKAGN